nr:MAG TPA: BssS protein family protein [Caudoviricetes sp.]
MTEEIENLTERDIRDIKNRDNTVVVLEEGEWGDELYMFKGNTCRNEVMLSFSVTVPCQGWSKYSDTVFMTPDQARRIANLLNKKANEAEAYREA